MTIQPEVDPQRKFEEMILLVARASEADPYFGATKLNKILFYADFGAYRRFGQSISGQIYQKLGYGPAPRRLVPVVEQMETKNLCIWVERDRDGYRQKQLIARREPDVSLFSAAEIQLLHQVVDDLRGLTAREASDRSHQFLGWKMVDYGEDIPYSFVYLDEHRPLTTEEEAWAEEAIRGYLAGENPVCS